MRDQATRFWARVDKSTPAGCWLWTGFIAPDGYAMFSDKVPGAGRSAHPSSLFPSYVCAHCGASGGWQAAT